MSKTPKNKTIVLFDFNEGRIYQNRFVRADQLPIPLLIEKYQAIENPEQYQTIRLEGPYPSFKLIGIRPETPEEIQKELEAKKRRAHALKQRKASRQKALLESKKKQLEKLQEEVSKIQKDMGQID